MAVIFRKFTMLNMGREYWELFIEKCFVLIQRPKLFMCFVESIEPVRINKRQEKQSSDLYQINSVKLPLRLNILT